MPTTDRHCIYPSQAPHRHSSIGEGSQKLPPGCSSLSSLPAASPSSGVTESQPRSSHTGLCSSLTLPIQEQKLPWRLEQLQLECLAQDPLWVDRGGICTRNVG